MQALAAAWLARLAFESYDITEMVKCLNEAFTNASAMDNEALGRAKLMGAVALHLAGRHDLAKSWYADTHAHATADGDDLAISALMHNIACMHVANLRQGRLDEGQRASINLVPNALREAEAAKNYDELIGSTGLDSWVPILRAQAHALRGEPARALQIYEDYIAEAESQGLERVLGYMNADMAWCRAQVGQINAALEEAALAEQCLGRSMLIDDVAATHSRLASIYALLGSDPKASVHMESSARAWDDFGKLQKQMVEQIAPLYRPMKASDVG